MAVARATVRLRASVDRMTGSLRMWARLLRGESLENIGGGPRVTSYLDGRTGIEAWALERFWRE
jgi:hypothetical protein